MNKTSKITLTLIMLFLIGSIIGFANALVVDSVIVDNKEISPGNIVEIDISLENNAEVDINDISVSLDLTNLPFAPYDSSSEYGIDEINEGRNKIARFKLIALNDAQPYIYKIPLKISYKEENENQAIIKNSLISLKVISKPVLGVNNEESLLLKGQTNDLSIKIINKGLGDVKFLEAEVLNSNNFNLLSSNKIYIGDLESDDFDSISFKIFFPENAPNKINFPIALKYKDSLNNEYSENVSIQLNAYNKEKATELGLVKRSYTKEIIVLVIILIVFYILYRYIKKTMKK